MTTYMVMLPPGADNPVASTETAERIKFIPDRFSWIAFIFSPFYLLWHRMWLPLIAYMAITVGLEVAALQLNIAAPSIAAFAVSVLLGFEASALRRWSLEGKGWRMMDVASGNDREEAELRFFHRQLTPKPAISPEPRTRTSGIVPKIGTEHVVGLTLGQETQR